MAHNRNRRALSRRDFIKISIIGTAAYTVFAIQYQNAMADWAAKNPGDKWLGQPGMQMSPSTQHAMTAVTVTWPAWARSTYACTTAFVTASLSASGNIQISSGTGTDVAVGSGTAATALGIASVTRGGNVLSSPAISGSQR